MKALSHPPRLQLFCTVRDDSAHRCKQVAAEIRFKSNFKDAIRIYSMLTIMSGLDFTLQNIFIHMRMYGT